MKKMLLSLIMLPALLLCACGTPMVWQGPAGTSEQDLANTKRECLTRSESWRRYNTQVTDQASIQTSGSADPRSTDELYSTADRLYQQCMVAEGYKLVPRAQ